MQCIVDIQLEQYACTHVLSFVYMQVLLIPNFWRVLNLLQTATLYLYVGNPTLYVGNNAVPVGVTTLLWKIMVSFYLQNLFEKLTKFILQNSCMEPNLPVYSSWTEHCLYMQRNIEPFINQVCATASEVTCLGEISSITTTSTSCSLLMLQTLYTTQAYLLKCTLHLHLITQYLTYLAAN